MGHVHINAAPLNSNPVAGLSGLIVENKAKDRNECDINRAHRPSHLEMVVHDIRSPIMSTQVSIDLVEEMHVQLSADGFQALESARSCLDKALRQAKSMLACFKERSKSRKENLSASLTEQISFDPAELSLFSQSMSVLTKELRAELAFALAALQKFQSLEAAALKPQCLEHLQRACSGIARSIGLIKDSIKHEYLFDTAVDLNKSHCLVSAIADDTVDLVKNLADKKQIKIVQNCPHETVNADKGRIAQVLINYLSNAIKFAPANSEIVLSCQVQGASLKFAVTDQGPGIGDKARERIFEKFYQALPRHESTGYGLGLSICKWIAGVHGGQVGVDSKPGKGSTFWLELPR